MFVCAEMVRIGLFKSARYETAFHTFVAAIWSCLGMGSAAKPLVRSTLENGLLWMFTLGLSVS
jgi:hypothetical protein